MHFSLPPRCLLLALCCLMPAIVGCRQDPTVRFATFNSALSKNAPGELVRTLETPDDPQAQAVAEIIQRVRPDVLLLQEFDHHETYDPDGRALELFQDNYLGVAQNGAEPIHYAHVYLAPSNTGIPSGHDLNNDGKVGGDIGTRDYGNDALGFGTFPGQYAFVILSKYPIDRENIRTFREFLWKDLPGNHIPEGFYTDEELAVLPLSSKNHVDVPIGIGGQTIHVLAAHPTPPAFDGPEDRNGRRNYDEIGIWALYLYHWSGRLDLLQSDDARPLDVPTATVEHGRGTWNPFGSTAQYSMTSAGRLVIMGDLNADPHDGDSFRPTDIGEPSKTNFWFWTQEAAQSAAGLLVSSPFPLGGDFIPTSPGGAAAAERQGGKNAEHTGDPAADTADFGDTGNAPGNLRVDYVLPSRDLEIVGGGVLWPAPDGPLMGVSLETAERASDHRLVWVDVKVP